MTLCLVRYSDDPATTFIMMVQEQNQQCHQILLMNLNLLPDFPPEI